VRRTISPKLKGNFVGADSPFVEGLHLRHARKKTVGKGKFLLAAEEPAEILRVWSLLAFHRSPGPQMCASLLAGASGGNEEMRRL